MLSHIPHALVYAGLCSLPLLIWIPLWLWADDEPRNAEPPEPDPEPDRNQAEIRLAA